MFVSINPEREVRDVVVIGASAGGIRAVTELLSALPPDLPAYIGVVIHRGAHSGGDWGKTLTTRTLLPVVEATGGERMVRGVVYLAPADCHLTFEKDHVCLDRGPKEHHTRPAVDPLFESAALEYGRRVVAIVLTGGGHDGMQGLRAVSSAGGITLVQKPSEAANASMPEWSIEHDHVRASLTIQQIAEAVVLLAKGDAVPIREADIMPATP